MVGGVLDPDNGWDIRKSLVEKVLKMFPGAQPIIPKLEPAFGSAMLAWSRYLDRLSKNDPKKWKHSYPKAAMNGKSVGGSSII